MLLLAASLAYADPAPPTAAHRPGEAFDRPFAVASYAAVRGGSYEAGGVGGRIRIQPFARFGLDAYLEATVVDWEGGFRHDYPNGFNLYAALPIGPVRVTPYIGACDVLSFAEPVEKGGPRADDVMVGLHAGVGAEVAVASAFSVFVDGQGDLYGGHDRSMHGWTGDVGEALIPVVTGQVNVGVQYHVPNFR